jgi:hypothetical protein
MADLPGITRFAKSWLGVGDKPDAQTAVTGVTNAFIQGLGFGSYVAPPKSVTDSTVSGQNSLFEDPGLARVYPTITGRGVFMLSSLFCASVGPPLVGVDTSPVQGGSSETRRQALAAATDGTPCVGCHSLLDSLGSSLEMLDPTTGERRSTDGNGLTIDASGSFALGEFPYSKIYSYTSYDDLGPQFTDSCEVLRCFVEAYVNEATTALGLPELTADELEVVVQSFGPSPHRLDELVMAFVQIPTFLQ